MQRSSGPRKESNKRSKEIKWNASDYPYATDYNDHFETPLQAYRDVQPLLDWFAETRHRDDNGDSNQPLLQQQMTKSAITLYDPYYCHGRAAVLLRELGYENVVHAKRDFYVDIAQSQIPHHDIVITNPPYSDNHKKRCLDFCLAQLRGDDDSDDVSGQKRLPRPFLLLMPAYTASKQYYRDCLTASSSSSDSRSNALEDVVYLVPSTSYHYEHPDQTGKDQSPFDSLWFCGIGKERVVAFQQYWESLPLETTATTAQKRPSLITCLADLVARKVISVHNRPNPRQRRKKRHFGTTDHSDESQAKCIVAVAPHNKRKHADGQSSSKPQNPKEQDTNRVAEKKSKYRDPNSGRRTKKRF
jgi:hypothetical protein